MKALLQACKLRDCVFDDTKRNDTLHLSNLAENNENAEEFFKETYITDGMKQLFDTAFRRFTGESGRWFNKINTVYGRG